MPGGSLSVSLAILSAPSGPTAAPPRRPAGRRRASVRRERADRIGRHRRHDLPAVLAGDLLPAHGAVEDDRPIRILGLMMMLASGSMTSAASTRPASSWGARNGEVGADRDDVLAEIEPLGGGVDLDHLILRRPGCRSRAVPAPEVGERPDLVVLGEDQKIGEANAVPKIRTPALPSCASFAGSSGRRSVRRSSRSRTPRRTEIDGYSLDVELEAVLRIETSRLHDVLDQRIEHRQCQARHPDLRLGSDARVPWPMPPPPRVLHRRDRGKRRREAPADIAEPKRRGRLAMTVLR